MHDGVIYVTASLLPHLRTDARSGKRLWEYEARPPEDIRPAVTCGGNRGAAIYGDKIYFCDPRRRHRIPSTSDTGKVVWRKKWGDHKVGYTDDRRPFVIQIRRAARCRCRFLR